MSEPVADIQLHESWKAILKDQFTAPYFVALKQFLVSEKQAGKVIYPPGKSIFAALDLTPPEQVKVVILGQDPYHGPGQAHGLCFSVNEGVRFPPSLQNIYKELQSDCQIPVPQTGNLTPWAKQGVLLLNATLTVRKDEAGSHQNKGWETFTDRIISLVSQQCDHVVFLLWGRFAQSKENLIDTNKHLVLKAAHPSPLSAYNGFFGCRHFSRANAFLSEKGLTPIDWKLG